MSDIIVGSVGVQLVPSAQGFPEKARALLKGLSVPVRLDIDDKAAQAQVEEFTRPREMTVKVDADTAGAQAKIEALDGSARRGSGGMGLLTIAAVGLAPALIPATAAVGGLVAALSAPALAAGGGLAGFIGVAGVAVSKTEAVKKQIDQLSKQAETTTDMASAKRYQAQADALIASLTGPQKALLTAQSTVGKAFSGLMKSAGPAIFTPIVTGLNLLAAVLPKLTPLIDAVSGALNTMLAGVAKSVESGALDKTIGFFAKMAGPSITGLATILGNIASGFMSMIQASAGLGGSLLTNLGKMTASFANVGQSGGFQSFLAYVQQVGPQVAKTLGAIVRAVGNIVSALAPLGGPALSAIQGIANALGSMNPTVLGLIASSIGGIAIGLKAMTIMGALAPMAKSFAAALGLVDVAADANPIGAIVVGLAALAAAFVYAWTKSQTFRTIVVGGLKAVADYFLGFVQFFVDAADKAFGWIPKIGPKLDAAASAVSAFKDSVNTSLDGITKTVTITLDIQRIDSSGAGNAAKNAQHSGGYQIPKSTSGTSSSNTSATAALPVDSSLFTSPSTTAATSAASAAASKKSQKAAQKLADNDSLLSGTKALKSAGKQLANALLSGLKAGNGGLQKYLDKIKSDIGSKLASGDISKTAAKSMRNTVNAISKGLAGVQKAYDNALTNVNGTGLKDLIQKKADLIQSVSSSMSGELDLSQGIVTTQPDSLGFGGGTSATFASVSSVVTGLATRLKTFAGLLKNMLTAGFPAGLVQEVAALGSANGITVAQALLSGSKTQISGLSSAFGSITSSANTIGTIIGNAMYDPGIAAQQGLLKGLLDDKGITAAGGTLAKKLIKAIRKALQIHSPSRLMASQVGVPAGDGVGVGMVSSIDGWVPDVAARMSSITPAAAAYSGYGSPGASGTGAIDYDQLAAAMAQMQFKLTVGDRDAARLVLAGSSTPLVTPLR